MAADYTDAYDGIAQREKISADKMTAALNKMEKVANKVTSLSGTSTDTQYPSAKAVYTEVNNKINKSNTYTKTEVDNKVAGVDLSGKVSTSGDTMTGNLTFSSDKEVILTNGKETLPSSPSKTKFATETQVDNYVTAAFAKFKF